MRSTSSSLHVKQTKQDGCQHTPGPAREANTAISPPFIFSPHWKQKDLDLKRCFFNDCSLCLFHLTPNPRSIRETFCSLLLVVKQLLSVELSPSTGVNAPRLYHLPRWTARWEHSRWASRGGLLLDLFLLWECPLRPWTSVSRPCVSEREAHPSRALHARTSGFHPMFT